MQRALGKARLGRGTDERPRPELPTAARGSDGAVRRGIRQAGCGTWRRASGSIGNEPIRQRQQMDSGLEAESGCTFAPDAPRAAPRAGQARWAARPSARSARPQPPTQDHPMAAEDHSDPDDWPTRCAALLADAEAALTAEPEPALNPQRLRVAVRLQGPSPASHRHPGRPRRRRPRL
jgi:hypothetical protein